MNSSTNIHSWTYTIFLMLLAASLPLSKFTMSVSEFALLGLWLWSGFSFTVSFRFFKIGGFFNGIIQFVQYIFVLAYTNIVDKFSQLFRNTPVLVFLTIYFIHLIGLLYTSDFTYAMKDLRVKLPLLLLPIVISTMEKQNYKRTRFILCFYVLSVFISTLISGYYYFTDQYVDIREISRFISPIRLGLNSCFAIVVLVYYIFHDYNFKLWHKLIMMLVAIWFISFLFILEALTGIIITLVIIVGYFIWRMFNTMVTWQQIVLTIAGVLIPVLFGLYIRNIVIEATTPPSASVFNNLDLYTSKGNLYDHDLNDMKVEDGKYVNMYICYKELVEEWNKRSDIDYNGKTLDGQRLNETLIRYLTSKDLRKDADGIAALSDYDISLIEKGMANYNYIRSPGLKTRILKIIKGYEVYRLTGNPSGNSVMQRLEYLKASFEIIESNFLFGVGTGDLEDAINRQFIIMNSSLEDQYKYHAHNQFIGIFVSLGLFGLLIFVIALFYPPLALHGFNDYFFRLFFIIIFISMFSDDTLETQAGVTLFAFFYTFLLFGRKIGDKMPAGVNN